MATFDVKTISCSSKITAKIEVNMDSLEREYKENKLNFQKTFAIDSGKGSNYTGHIAIYDRGKCFSFPSEFCPFPGRRRGGTGWGGRVVRGGGGLAWVGRRREGGVVVSVGGVAWVRGRRRG